MTAAAGIPSAYTTIETPAAGSSSKNKKNGNGSGSGGSRAPAGLQTLDGDLSAMYLPSSGKAKKNDTNAHGHGQQGGEAGGSHVGHGQGANKRETVIRKGNGKMWEDATLLDWDPSELPLLPTQRSIPLIFVWLTPTARVVQTVCGRRLERRE